MRELRILGLSQDLRKVQGKVGTHMQNSGYLCNLSHFIGMKKLATIALYFFIMYKK